jgi:hypothetical protein
LIQAFQHHQDNSDNECAMNWRKQAVPQLKKRVGFVLALFAVSFGSDVSS